MIVYPDSYILSAYPSLKNARIGWRTYTRDLTAAAVTADEDSAATPADAPLRPDTAEYWMPPALPATWLLDLGESLPVEYVGIAAHTLGTEGCTVEARLSDDLEFVDYLRLQASDGNYASTPDSAAISITGDLDIELELTIDNADLPAFSLDFLGDFDASILKITGGSPTVGTFTRSDNTATRVNASGLVETVNANIARQDFDPVTRAALGFRCEEARTNICIRTTLAGGGAAPTGWTQPTATGSSAPATSIYGDLDGAVAYSQSAASQRPFIQSTAFSVSASSTYRLSMYVESVTGSLPANQVLTASGFPAGAAVSYVACPANPTGASGGNITTGRLEAVLTVDVTAGTAQLRCGIGVSSNSIGSLQFSRPQVELVSTGGAASSWIPTTASSATRNADVLTLTDLNAMGFNASEGTLVSSFNILNVATSQRFIELDDGTSNERIILLNSSGNYALVVTDGGVAQVAASTGLVAVGITKMAGCYALNDFAVAMAGGNLGTDVSGTLPTVNKCYIGCAQGSAAFLNGHIQEFFYYATRRDNSRLQDFSRQTYRCLAAKWVESGNQRSWALCLKENCALVLFVSTDGTAAGIREFHSAPLDVASLGRFFLRVQLDISVGSPTLDAVCVFETSDDGVTYSTLSTVTQAAITGIFDSTAALELGSFNGGTSEFEGRLHSFRLRGSLGGATVAHFDAEDAASEAATSWASDTGETWTVHYSGSPQAAQLVQHVFSEAHAPADDSPIMLVDAARTRRYLRLGIEGDGDPPRLAVVNVGPLLAMQRAVRGGGFVPTKLARETTLQQVVSRGGQFLGQNIRRTGIKGNLPFTYLTPDWVRDYFDAFALAARSQPFFVAWRPETYPQDVAYAWATDDLRPSYMGTANFQQVTIPFQGIGDATS